MNTNENYRAVCEGRMSEKEFLRQTRQNLPGYISQFTSYDDAINILRRRGILSEEVIYQCQGDRFPLESIDRGIRYELEQAGIYDVTEVGKGDYKEAKKKAIENLCKDPLYYINIVAGGDKKRAEKNQKEIDTNSGMFEVKPRKNLQEVSREDLAAHNSMEGDRLFQDFLIKYKQLLPTKGPEEHASKACMAVRKALGQSRWLPSRSMMQSKKLSYDHKEVEVQTKDGKTVKKPVFSYGYTRAGVDYKGSARTGGIKGSIKESKLLKEAIVKKIQKILAEAATTNLAQFSDENSSVQGIPAILNNLENVVTEIESFILKEKTKIQSIFDSIGAIKNEDNIPVGFKFARPIMESFQKDLEPVLQKISFDDIKLPDAPEADTVEPVVGEEEPELEPKETVFSPRNRKEQSLQESKSTVRRRYTK